MHILDKIVKHKKEEVDNKKRLYPTALLEKSLYFKSKTVSMSTYIKRKDKSGVIAEFKKKSPSKPDINLFADVEAVTIGYMQAGASGLSVLTDNHFFGGSQNDLITARKYNFCPILRKDFIIDEYQILEARSMGADAILLIAEILTAEQIKRFTTIAIELGMEVLTELHSRDQLSKINDDIHMIGINNRDLKSFSTNINFSVDLIAQLPKDRTLITESGIHSVNDMVKLKKAGYDGFLIGERFMVHDDPGRACKVFIDQFNKAMKNEG